MGILFYRAQFLAGSYLKCHPEGDVRSTHLRSNVYSSFVRIIYAASNNLEQRIEVIQIFSELTMFLQ